MGFADTEFKIKWRFVDADTNSWLPSIGIAPKAFFPTSDKDRGLGDGVWRAQLPLQFGKTIGRFYNFAEAGYQMAFDKKASDVAYHGLGTLYNFNSHLALGTEVFGYIPPCSKKESSSAGDARRGLYFQRTLGAQGVHQPHIARRITRRAKSVRRVLPRLEFLATCHEAVAESGAAG